MASPVISPPATIHRVRLPNLECVPSDVEANMVCEQKAMTAPSALSRHNAGTADAAPPKRSSHAGSSVPVAAAHGTEHRSAPATKPSLRRSTSPLVGRVPSAATTGSRMSRYAESGSGMAASMVAAATAGVTSVAMRVDCRPDCVTDASALFCGRRMLRRAMAALSAADSTLSGSGRSSMPGRTYTSPGMTNLRGAGGCGCCGSDCGCPGCDGCCDSLMAVPLYLAVNTAFLFRAPA